jgi:sporulation protein YlmC with PRC-barrel domain
MFTVENLADWIGKTVIDPDGTKIGELDAVYVDTTNDEPSFLTIKIGMIGRHRLVFAPASGATLTPETLRVQYPKKLIQDAPTIDTDGELPADQEPALFTHYQLDYGTPTGRRLARR